jgi:hypothetical protein
MGKDKTDPVAFEEKPVEEKPVEEKPVEEGKRPRGRPPKDAPPIDPKEPAPRPRKPDADIRDTRGAIDRAVQSLATFARAYQVEHPESDLAWVWRRIREAMPEETGRIGAPIDESAFAPLVRGPVRGVELLGDLPEEEKASAQEINDVAESWARASTHLGLSERVAAVGSAVTKTVGLVGRQLTRTIIAMTAAPPAKPEKSSEAAAFEETPVEEVKP